MTPVDFTLVTHLTNRKTPEIRAAIRTQFAEIISQEYEVETIAVDGEGAIAKLREEFEESGYQVNTSGPKQHVPEVERKIGTLKGRIRSIHHSLAWQLPYTLLRYQVSYARLVLNMDRCIPSVMRRKTNPTLTTRTSLTWQSPTRMIQKSQMRDRNRRRT